MDFLGKKMRKEGREAYRYHYKQKQKAKVFHKDFNIMRFYDYETMRLWDNVSKELI